MAKPQDENNGKVPTVAPGGPLTTGESTSSPPSPEVTKIQTTPPPSNTTKPTPASIRPAQTSRPEKTIAAGPDFHPAHTSDSTSASPDPATVQSIPATADATASAVAQTPVSAVVTQGHPVIVSGLVLVWIVTIVGLWWAWREAQRRRRERTTQRWNYARGYADGITRRGQAGGHLRSVD